MVKSPKDLSFFKHFRNVVVDRRQQKYLRKFYRIFNPLNKICVKTTCRQGDTQLENALRKKLNILGDLEFLCKKNEIFIENFLTKKILNFLQNKNH